MDGQTIRFFTRFSTRFFTRFFTQLPKPKRAKSRTLRLKMAAKKQKAAAMLILVEVLENKDELDDNSKFTSDLHFYTIKMAVLSPRCKNNSRAKQVIAHALIRLTRQMAKRFDFHSTTPFTRLFWSRSNFTRLYSTPFNLLDKVAK